MIAQIEMAPENLGRRISGMITPRRRNQVSLFFRSQLSKQMGPPQPSNLGWALRYKSSSIAPILTGHKLGTAWAFVPKMVFVPGSG